MPVLWDMGIYPDLEMFEAIPSRALKTWDRALDTLRHRLFVQPGTAQDELLQTAMRELLLETPEGYIVKGAQPGRLALISWRPVLFPE